jgi:hypothetical protein
MKPVKAEFCQVWILNGRGEWVLHYVNKCLLKAEKKFKRLKAGFVFCQLRSPTNDILETYESSINETQTA